MFGGYPLGGAEDPAQGIMAVANSLEGKHWEKKPNSINL